MSAQENIHARRPTTDNASPLAHANHDQYPPCYYCGDNGHYSRDCPDGYEMDWVEGTYDAQARESPVTAFSTQAALPASSSAALPPLTARMPVLATPAAPIVASVASVACVSDVIPSLAAATASAIPGSASPTLSFATTNPSFQQVYAMIAREIALGATALHAADTVLERLWQESDRQHEGGSSICAGKMLELLSWTECLRTELKEISGLLW